MINTIFKSENEENKNKINKFYVSNSEAFMNYIKINNLYFLFNNKNIQNDQFNLIEEINKENLKGHQLDIYNKYSKSKEIISKYSEKEFKYEILQDKNISNSTIKDKNEDIIDDDDLIKFK